MVFINTPPPLILLLNPLYASDICQIVPGLNENQNYVIIGPKINIAYGNVQTCKLQSILYVQYVLFLFMQRLVLQNGRDLLDIQHYYRLYLKFIYFILNILNASVVLFVENFLLC